MSLKYGVTFCAMAMMAFSAMVVTVYSDGEHWLGFIYGWIGVSLLTVGIAYLAGTPEYLLKRYTGKRIPIACLVHLPYFVLCAISFGLYRLTHRNDVAYAEVVPGLWFGRRLNRAEIKRAPVQWNSVLDLAAEFAAIPIKSNLYHSVPLLDGAVPSKDQVERALQWVDVMIENQPVLIHCALGHGRTGCVVLAWLVTRGRIDSLDEGIQKLKALRQGFGISPDQRKFLEDYLSEKIKP